ncbi:MAG TPA: hypothetical protein DDY45_01085 [Verrucomicrobiales bacterium]|nr:hypothetical protein [Verrucomicrobiales bacterium]
MRQIQIKNAETIWLHWLDPLFLKTQKKMLGSLRPFITSPLKFQPKNLFRKRPFGTGTKQLMKKGNPEKSPLSSLLKSLTFRS